MNVSASHSPLTDLVSYNQPATSSSTSQTTVATAQQTLASTPGQVLSGFVPPNTSLDGAAPAVDSLLGNISTSAGLNALSQLNSTRFAATQISPFTDTSDALAYASNIQQSVAGTLLAGELESTGASLALPAAYYSRQYSAAASSTSAPELNITA